MCRSCGLTLVDLAREIGDAVGCSTECPGCGLLLSVTRRRHQDLLEEYEDRLDVAAAREALAEPGRVPWEKVKADLGLGDTEGEDWVDLNANWVDGVKYFYRGNDATFMRYEYTCESCGAACRGVFPGGASDRLGYRSTCECGAEREVASRSRDKLDRIRSVLRDWRLGYAEIRRALLDILGPEDP